MRHCITLVSPTLVTASARFAARVEAFALRLPSLVIEREHEAMIAASAPAPVVAEVDADEPLTILYTNGTTSLLKGAAISHRAEIARMCVLRMDLHVTEADGFLAWAPLFHMGSTDQTLGALMSGATVFIVDGFDAERIMAIMAENRLGWMLLMPGSIEPVIELMKASGRRPKGVCAIGAMADLVPKALVAELSGLANALYLDSFGSTEIGLAPASAMLFPPGLVPDSLAKRKSSPCELRLVDQNGDDVPDGAPGETTVPGPTVFSGYWNAPDINARDFAGGWFRMGDLLRRTPEGDYDFVDRSKYMIKSGGENIYPAEIERVLLADVRVPDAVVIRKADAKWGEVPVAFVARADEALDDAGVGELRRRALAGYKRPKAIHFIAFDDFPRSTTGKILRHEMEKLYKGLLA